MVLSNDERYKLMKRRGWKCDRCGKRVTTSTGDIHHKDRNPKNDNLSNLRVLCRPCHFEVHGKEPPGH
ncbi:MAG: HNH endonuclease signature motif containing protein [Candidatus Aminicenantia bacterium]